MSDIQPRFLSVRNVLRLHRLAIAKYGGDAGLRDMGLLESAIAQPMAAYQGEFLHPGYPEMAAAYVFHLTKNHSFVDGNKRAAALAAITFLRLNGMTLNADEVEFEQLVLDVASGNADKARVAEFFARNIKPRYEDQS